MNNWREKWSDHYNGLNNGLTDIHEGLEARGTMSNNWREQWLDNYNGLTAAHKDLEARIKKNYKGNKYIPWATMVKWLYLQDPYARLDVLKSDNGYVFTSTDELVVEKGGALTRIPVRAHSVVLNCTFMGTTFTEIYPVQDKAYDAPNSYDSNMINKAIQRAKAKIISTATGIAYKLYEAEDLQWDDDKDTKKVDVATIKLNEPTEPAATIKPNEQTEPAATITQKPLIARSENTVGKDDPIQNTVNFINNTPDIDKVLQVINIDVLKNYGVTLVPHSTDLYENISKLRNVPLFLTALKKRYDDYNKTI